MIAVKDRTLLVPIDEQSIGYVGDNKFERRIFEVTNSSLFSFDFQLDLRNSANVIIGVVPLIKIVEVDKITLTWEILEEHLQYKGQMSIQIRAFTDNELKWHSKIAIVYVGESISATSLISPIAETEFAIQEQRIVALKNETQSARDTTITKASEVAINTQTVENDTDLVVQLHDSVQDDVNLILSKVSIAENSATTSTTQAGIATTKAQIATEQANLAIANATITTNDKNTVVAKAIEVSDDKDIVVTKANEVSANAVTVANNKDTVVSKALQVSTDASQVAQDKKTVAADKESILGNTQIVSDKTEIVVAKEILTAENVQSSLEIYDNILQQAGQIGDDRIAVAADKAIVSSDKAIVIADTNAVSVDKDAVVSAKNATELLKSDVETLKGDTSNIYSDCVGILNQQTSLLATTPTWYVKDTIENMNAITTMKDSDFCIIISAELESQSVYRYFTKDINGVDLVTPAWVWISDLSLLQLTQSYLLSILQLPTVATSGSYPDLINKPNRYESFITVTNGIWDYSLSDKIILTTNNLSSIINVTNGAVGIINTSYDLTLPSDSKKAVDYDYIIATAGQSYTYTFLYNGVNYYWSRVVVV